MLFLLNMHYEKYLFAVLAVISVNDAVKVNMQGTLSFGKEVMDTVSHYMKRNFETGSGRRSVIPNQDSDVVFLIIQSSYICRDLRFCDGFLEKFLNEYILVQTKSIEAILKGIIFQQNEIDHVDKTFIFEDELKKCLIEIQKMLRRIDAKVTENITAFAWTEVIKRISVMFQTEAILFATERIEGTPADLKEVKKKLTQKFVVASVIIEGKYESKLCAEYNICIKTFECTKALHTLLESFKEMSDENVKIFLRYVSETLMETKFYQQLSEVTANELQIILNDMAYSDSVPTREVLLSIHKTVEERLASIQSKKHNIKARDTELVHGILSDLDHAYSKRSVVDPFHSFMSSFFEWLRTGARLGPSMRTLLKDLAEQVNKQSNDLVLKLTNEVRVFLELTVDPEK
ncbi:hypothetical protein PYW08_013785 [Mythimna loreyi]|uniref:Uncharacterized protein n=1 Tax=Mythimna loreyi TaxID=667449 RepID=A0ACC2R5P8_9NEOP|nr:hypothetical protein PYW08_013785 [Mythimna loreyi]